MHQEFLCHAITIELKKKFGLDLINPVSILSFAASLDPRSCGLTYLNDDKCQAVLKQELLQKMTNNSSDKDKECEESSSKEKEAAPPPKKKKKSKEAKDKDYKLEFFGGNSSDKDC